MAEDPPPTNNNDVQEQTPARQEVDVLLDVSELEVDRIKLTVKDLRAHVSVLAELASLLNLQVGVDARLDEVELEIEGVRAKVLLKVRLDDIRAILKEALETVAEHPEILRILTRALDELVEGFARGRLGHARGGPRGLGGGWHGRRAAKGQGGGRSRHPPRGLESGGRASPGSRASSPSLARGSFAEGGVRRLKS